MFGRGVSINEKSGCIAYLTEDRIIIFEPDGSNSYTEKCHYTFERLQKLVEISAENELYDRIRFIDDNIYLFRYSTKNIYIFKLINNELIYIDVLYDKYWSNQNITDFMVTSSTLIVLFRRWIGIYTLYPKLEWYHVCRNNIYI